MRIFHYVYFLNYRTWYQIIVTSMATFDGIDNKLKFIYNGGAFKQYIYIILKS